MLAPRDLSPLETRPDLKGFGSGDGEHRVSELGLELIEDGFAQSGGDVADDAGDSTTDGV